jgi:DNA-binding CsgD family transcriptional regulator
MKKLCAASFSDFIHNLYSTELKIDFFQHALTVFKTHIPCIATSYSLFDLTASRHEIKGVMTQKQKFLSNDDIKHINRLISEDHPYIPYFRSIGAEPLLSTSDIMSSQEWRSSKWYNEIYRPLGLVHNTGIRFYRGSLCHFVAVNDTVPLPAEYREMLSLAAPHLAKAFDIHTSCLKSLSNQSTDCAQQKEQNTEQMLISSGLTRRESEVLRHLSKGLSNKQLAGILGISSKTVGRHLESIYSKLDCNNRHSVTQIFRNWNSEIGSPSKTEIRRTTTVR